MFIGFVDEIEWQENPGRPCLFRIRHHDDAGKQYEVSVEAQQICFKGFAPPESTTGDKHLLRIGRLVEAVVDGTVLNVATRPAVESRRKNRPKPQSEE